jgi:hypothetical protein
MLIEATVKYVAGRPPGESYDGTATVSVNVAQDATDEQIAAAVRDRAVGNIATSFGMYRHAITVTEVTVNRKALV